jgi:hypothetical protein
MPGNLVAKVTPSNHSRRGMPGAHPAKGIQICKDISTSFADRHIESSVVKAQLAPKLLAGGTDWPLQISSVRFYCSPNASKGT